MQAMTVIDMRDYERDGEDRPSRDGVHHFPPSGRRGRGPKRPRLRRIAIAGADPTASSRTIRVLSTPWAPVVLDALMLAVATAAAGARHPHAAAVLWLYPLLALAVTAARGLYSPRLRVSIVDVVPSVCLALSLPAMLLVTAATIGDIDRALLTALNLAWVCAIILVCTGRAALLSTLHRARLQGRAGSPALIVGGGEVGRGVARRLVDRPEFGLRPVGILEVGPASPGEGGVPHVGRPEDMLEAAARTGARYVILAFSGISDRQLQPHVRRCREAGLEVLLVPRMFESVGERVRIDCLGGLPLLSVRTADPKGWHFAVKYVLDRCVGALLLILFGPLMLACALAVRLDSPGPVLFRQRRVGLDGREFDLLKFRSMRHVPEGQPGFVPPEGVAPGGVEGEDRRTRLGCFLRRSCLDELPQLINVLRGEMSLVGPRPERPEFVEMFAPQIAGYEDRHRVKSGMTGWAQVHGLRGQTSLQDRVEFDNHYICNWSLGLDLKILLLTFRAIMMPEGPPAADPFNRSRQTSVPAAPVLEASGWR